MNKPGLCLQALFRWEGPCPEAQCATHQQRELRQFRCVGCRHGKYFLKARFPVLLVSRLSPTLAWSVGNRDELQAKADQQHINTQLYVMLVQFVP